MEETLRKLREALEPLYGKGESDAIIRLIFHYVKGWNLTDMLIHAKDDLSPFIKKEIDGILARLLNNEPIQYITGEARFHGMDFKIKPGVLIPRPETEELADIIIDENGDKSDLKVLDLCTGSGVLAITLARNLPFSIVTALDISPVAIEVATENGVRFKTKIEWILSDIFEWKIPKKFNIFVSNPPYVMDKEALSMEKNVLDFEPHEALFVRDENPLAFYAYIARMGLHGLTDDGRLYFEINPLTAGELKRMVENLGYQDVEILKDSFGKNRFLKAAR